MNKAIFERGNTKITSREDQRFVTMIFLVFEVFFSPFMTKQGEKLLWRDSPKGNLKYFLKNLSGTNKI